jgi:hypothetical protein
LRSQQANLDARAVLHVAVPEVDLEPVPDEDGNLVEDKGMMHALLLSGHHSGRSGEASIAPAAPSSNSTALRKHRAATGTCRDKHCAATDPARNQPITPATVRHA